MRARETHEGSDWLGGPHVEPRTDGRCPMCGDSGWCIDFRPDLGGPVALEFMPCIYPRCTHSGRPIAVLSLVRTQLRHANVNPLDDTIMSVTP